jgi:hypothetical protein
MLVLSGQFTSHLAVKVRHLLGDAVEDYTTAHRSNAARGWLVIGLFRYLLGCYFAGEH